MMTKREEKKTPLRNFYYVNEKELLEKKYAAESREKY